MNVPTLVITGGSSGIGGAIAVQAANAGYDVAILCIDAAVSDGETVADQIRSVGRKALVVATDVTDGDRNSAAFDRVMAEFGSIDAAVNAAGLLYSQECHRLDAQQLAAMISVNVTGLILSCREEVLRMRTSSGGAGGGIVNISSMAGTIGGRPRGASYAASKAAVDSFTTGLAKEVASEGIRVNAVRPGLVATGLTTKILEDPAQRQAIEASIPMGRVGEPQEIADAVLWLLSERAGWVSGAHLDVSGGGFIVSGSF